MSLLRFLASCVLSLLLARLLFTESGPSLESSLERLVEELEHSPSAGLGLAGERADWSTFLEHSNSLERGHLEVCGPCFRAFSEIREVIGGRLSQESIESDRHARP